MILKGGSKNTVNINDVLKTVRNIEIFWGHDVEIFNSSLEIVIKNKDTVLSCGLKNEINKYTKKYDDQITDIGKFYINKYDFKNDYGLETKLFGLAIFGLDLIEMSLEQMVNRWDTFLYMLLHEVGHLELGPEERPAWEFADYEMKELLKGKYDFYKKDDLLS